MDTVFQGCRWIGGAKESPSPLIIRRFQAKAPRKAQLYITGLGYFHARINGKEVTDHRLQPVCSEYGPRDLEKFQYPLQDTLTYRIYYCTYDVSDLIKDGENVLTVQLGNGWYRQTERSCEGPMAYGDQLKTIFCLSITGAHGQTRICSDGSEHWKDSEITYNSLYIGETQDLRRKDLPVQPVELLPPETGMLCPQIGTPDKIIRTISPRLLSQRDGLSIYDAGENITGVVRLRTRGPAGACIRLQFAENLNSTGDLDFASTGSHYVATSGVAQIQTDVCICSGEEELFEPKFTWHGFRYFSLEGPGCEPEVLVIHSDTPVTGSFRSDSEGLNFLFDAYLRSQLGNMHGSIPSDCPHRERLGYTGDGQVAAAAAMMLLDSREFYRKWIRDIFDGQDISTGHIQHTAPLGGGGGGPVGWGGAAVIVPYRYYKQFGETALIAEFWNGMLRWTDYIQSRMEDGLITNEEPGGWCLGDWATLEKTVIPEPFVNTCLFVRCIDMLEELASILEKEEDLPNLTSLRERCREAIRATYFDDATGSFCGGVQGADAYGLYAGLGDHRTLARLVEKYFGLGAFDTGFIGTDVLLEVLFDRGEQELAWKLLCSEKMGSFLYMKRHGATTIWEHWDGSESHNHPMFGGCVRHLFEGFLGIRQAYGTGGYEQVTVTPCLPTEMDSMEGSLLTPRGRLNVSLKRQEGHIHQEISLP